jgi:4-amino-4-deoxy-L-arabinose transferase-like glycosyltransferase
MRWGSCAASLVLLLSLVTLYVRPLLPIDETRYVAVAWEAHVRGDLLVSHLNGDTYAHKPPMLFWLINLIWAVFGVSSFGARLPGPLAGVICVLLTWRTARLLDDDSRETADCAAFVHASSLLWLFFCPLTMFDTLLTLSAELAVQGVLLAGLGSRRRGWLQTGLAAGLGILCKGPVVLLWIFPVALAAPWWLPTVPRGGWRAWYGLLVAAVVLSAVVALAWALPSAAAGGPDYAQELLFGQTAGRMVDSFSHRQPLWWYLPIAPLCLLPWLLWPAVWQGLLRTAFHRGRSPWQIRWLLVRAGSGFVLLSLTSGKQVYYLLPMIPPCAVLLAELMRRSGCLPSRLQIFPVAAGTVVLGAVPILINHSSAAAGTGLQGLVSDGAAAVMMACGGVLFWPRFRTWIAATAVVSTAATVFVALLTISLRSTLWDGFDIGPLARAAGTAGVPAGWLGGYHGQLNFAGGLLRVEELADAAAFERWLGEQGEAALVVRLPRGEPLTGELEQALQQLDRQRPDERSGRILAEQLQSVGVIPPADAGVRLEFVQRLRTGLRESLHVLVRYTARSD